MATFDEQVTQIKEAFEQLDGWAKRKEIADVIGVKQLNISQRTILQVLVREGYIEERQEPTSAPSKYRYVYRLASKN